MKKIVIAGGSGFLGKELTQHWKNKEVVTLTRNKTLVDGKSFIYWDGKTLGEWTEELGGADLLLNLSGRSVNCRYNEANKKLILDSRIQSTHILGEAIRLCKKPPKVWMNASSATIYRNALDRPMDEKTGEIGEGFSVGICKAWENALNDENTPNTRKIALRTSIVMGPEKEGVYDVLRGLALCGLGGRQGKGNQFVSWIHIEDYISAIEFIYANENLDGAINICAPNPETNTKVMAALRRTLNVKIKLDLAIWMVKLGAIIRGTEAELVLKSRCVIPTKLVNAGYKFKFDAIEGAFIDLNKRFK